MQQLISPLGHTSLKVIPQEKVSSLNLLQKKLNDVIKNYGEGLMLHHQEALYFAGRSKFLLKLKKHLDAEAKVISYIPGKGKYSGMLGSLLVETPEGLRFKIGSGFTDKQRMTPPEIGCIITYKYFGKTSKGLPRFASFIRIRHPKNLIAAHLKE
jgi:DNA ligase-1